MGGSAFPDTVRLTEAERQRVVAVVTAALESRGDGVKVQAPVEVHDKAELCRALGKDAPYGDVDFVVGVPPTQLSHAAEKMERGELMGLPMASSVSLGSTVMDK